MNQDERIIIVGMECQDLGAIANVKNCDLVYARSSLAAQWLVEIYEKDVIQVGGEGTILDDQSIETWLTQIQAALASDKRVGYVTSITPVMIDHLVVRLVRQFGIEQIVAYQGTLRILENLPLQAAAGLEQLLTLDGLTLQNKYHPPFHQFRVC